MSQKRKYFNNREKTKAVFEKHGQEIIQMYINGEKPRIIGDKFEIEEYTVYNYIRINKIPTKKPYNPQKCDVDENYFENIDSDDKAYFLGWLMSDGSINRKRNSVTLSLQLRDKEILEKFKIALKAEHSICEYIGSSNYIKEGKRKMVSISVSNKKLCDDLIALGCIQKKSLVLKFPPIEEKFLFPFLRGFIEGDGWVCTAKKKYSSKLGFMVGFVATEEFLRTVFGFLSKYDFTFSVYQNKGWKKGINLYCARINRKNKVIEILDRIYENHNNLCLSRKYNKYLEMKQYLLDNPLDLRYVRKTKTNNPFI